MKVIDATKKEFTLILTLEEAKWLREMVQNPINVCLFDREAEYNKEMRAKFWNALEGVEK